VSEIDSGGCFSRLLSLSLSCPNNGESFIDIVLTIDHRHLAKPNSFVIMMIEIG
jgi:hypothetical protein